MTDTFCIWLTGLSGSGKTTLANILTRFLSEDHTPKLNVCQLDGDIVRSTVCADLGFSPEDRNENITRMIGVASWLVHYGGIVPICSFISPYEALRSKAKKAISRCLMVEVCCPVEICEQRDPKGLYKRARAGEIPQFTGISAPFEDVECADLTVHTNTESPERIAMQIVAKLKQKDWL